MYGTLNSDFRDRRVVIYGRVSTEHEAQLSALENQLDWYKPILASRPNWNLVETYVDQGITGTSAKKRPEFLRMIRDAKKKKFDMIITREVSRFARNTVDTLQYTRDLKAKGVEVYFINDNIRTFDGDGELRLTIMATLAQDESRKTSIRVKSGQQTSMNNGVFYGSGNILGYDRVGKDMVINPEQAKTVRMIFDMYLNGYGTEKIKYELEKQGRKTALGKDKWFASVISKTLQNSFYCGIIKFHKEYTPDYLTQKKIRNWGEIEFTYTKGRHEPIVTEEEFYQVQNMIEERRKGCKNLNSGKRGHGINTPKTLWSKLLVCSCGNGFNRRTWSRTDGNVNYGYICYTTTNLGSIKTRENKGLTTEGSCQTPMIPEWKLQLMAKHIFQKHFIDTEEIMKKASRLIDNHINDKGEKIDNSELIEVKQKEIERLQKKLDNYIEMRAEGDISKEVFKIKTSELEDKVLALNKEISALVEEETEEQEEPDYHLQFEQLHQMLMELISKDFEYDVPDSVIQAMFKKIAVDKNTFTWYLRVGKQGKKDYEEQELLTSFVITLDDAKKYLYKISSRKRIYNWNDLTVNIMF